MDLALLNAQQHAPDILLAHAGAGILETAGQSRIFVAVVYVLDGIETCSHIGIRIRSLTVRKYIAGLDRVAAAEFPRIYADHFSQQIDVHLGRKAALRYAESAECAGRNIVCIYRHAEYIDILVIVRSRSMCAGTVKHGAAQRRISTGIGDYDALHTRKYSVLIAGSRKLHLHRMALNMVCQRLLTRIFNLDGLLCNPCHECRVLLDRHILLAAEAASYQRCAAVNLLCGDLQHGRALALYIVNRLAGCIDEQTVVALGKRNRALGLHKAVLLPGGLVFARNNVF